MAPTSGTDSATESLLSDDSTGTCCCGLKRDFTRWVQWRSLSQNGGSNRLPFQCLCSLLLVIEMVPYFLWVKKSTALCVIGGFFLIKALIEIWGQQTPTWICPGSVCMLLVIYTLIIPTVAYMYGYCTMASDINFKGRDIVGMTLYFGGSFFSLAYEVGRFQWKALPENKGKLHTIGLAAWCIHPNYLGDLFTYTGWALACGTSCAVSIPIFMVWTFMFAVVPNSDTYLAQRYPLEFPAYAEKTATLIPGLHSKIVSQILGWVCLLISVYCWCFTCAAPCGY